MKKVTLVRVFLFLSFTSLAVGCGNNNDNNAAAPPATTTTTSGTSGQYEQMVLADGPASYWLLNEQTGISYADQINSNTLFNGPINSNTGVSEGASSPINNDSNTGILLTSGYINSTDMISSPTTFSVEFWFNANLGISGRIFGFGSNKTGTSTSYDRHLYLGPNGSLYFGVGDGAAETVNTSNSLADGVWHYVVATYDDSTKAMDLYVDGQLATAEAINPNNIHTYNGFWRIGQDNLNGWPHKPSTSFNGSLAQIAVYDTALTQTQVLNHYAAAGH